MEVVDWKATLTRKDPHKALTSGFHRSHGRNAFGRITTRHKGGGAKRLWREIDFYYDKVGIPGRVESLEYDPNRTSFIALLGYQDGEKRYVLAPRGMKVGDTVVTAENASVEIGNRLPLKNIPIGTIVYNIEIESGRGAQMARSAGSGAIIIAQEGGYTNIQLPSKEVRMVRSGNWASIGTLSNPEHSLMTIGKAGRARHMGIRPTVRGTAMNPVDHPHGGGEGRTLTGRRRGPATPWGKPARGVKTRNRRKKSNVFIVSRRRK
ncbi:MAG: 50S ribosomal protein L2 [Parcubacteria group bacterium GW2011_GWB1_50_9]|nr:MAG: 50S ribosomal protein L2 [Parcubacteria group bacterium GW2011_GWB1_50_9]KKW21315.1 MAG: 50S ribosomal protein L2 [Candidatus Adlerbacteria bacterium GW2011_GWC1_50_9]KKW33831.1 MAG: 50S ribosomal protein L2 [Parcubacteria group bacterium GW2011_GWA1_53_13]